MLGLWLENKTLTLRKDLTKPIPKKNEALVKILKTGICGTDIELTKGYYPYTGVLGHEFVGIVEKGPKKFLGKRVVGELNIACHQCEICSLGLKNHCVNRKVLGIISKNGTFSEYITLPLDNLHIVPKTVSTSAAVFTEPLAAALAIQQQIKIKPGQKVVVIGDGKLGLLITQTLLLKKCELYVVGRYPNRLKLLKQRGAIVGDKKIIRPHSFDIAIECTGNPQGFDLALLALKPKGKLIMKSTYADKLHIDAARIVVNEITVMGSRCGAFEPALRLLANKKIDTTSLIEKQYPLTQALDAFKHASQRGTLKIIIDNEARS